MKRFLWAAVLALFIHVLLFGFGGHFFHKEIVKPISQPLSFTLVASTPKPAGKKLVKMAAKAEVPKPPEPEKVPEKEDLPKKEPPAPEKVIPKVKPPAEEKPVKIHKPTKRKSVREKQKTIDTPEVPVSNNKGMTSEHHPDVQPKNASADVKAMFSSGPKVVSASPAYARNPRPKYPRVARRRGYEGVVLLKVLVDQEGRVDDALVLKSSGHNVLDRSALKAVKNWVFKPGTVDDEPMKMWVQVPIQFELKRR